MPEISKEKATREANKLIDEYEMILNELHSVAESIRDTENPSVEFGSNKDVINERILI